MNEKLKKILVVDDDQGILEVIRIILSGKNFETVTSANGSSAVKVVKEISPDLLMIDLWMADLDGHKVIRALRGDPSTKNLPVIVISALSEGERIAKDAGADAFLAKPFNINDLVSLVQKHLAKSKLAPA